MSCVSPPLVAKPARGYGWTCAPCSRRHEDQVDNGGISHVAGAQGHNRENTPRNGAGNGLSANGRTGRGRGRPRKEKLGATPMSSEEELQVKHYKLWPFRYFGFVSPLLSLRQLLIFVRFQIIHYRRGYIGPR